MPDRAFRNLWLATSVSQLGTQVSELAIPFIAVTTLRAAPFEIGVLNAVQFLPILLLSLVVGVWVDRLRRRPVLIASDLARAFILFSIPAAAIWHVVSLPQLYIVGFLVGSFTVLFDVAYQSYLPAVVDREQFITANSRLQISEQSASVIGPAFGGSLISLLTAPIAVIIDAVSYLASAGLLIRIHREEPAPLRTEAEVGARREIADGLRFVWRQPILRAMVMTAGLTQLFGRMVFAVLLLYLVREVGLGAAGVGTIFSLGSVGFVVGALIAGRERRARGGPHHRRRRGAGLRQPTPLRLRPTSPRRAHGRRLAFSFTASLLWAGPSTTSVCDRRSRLRHCSAGRTRRCGCWAGARSRSAASWEASWAVPSASVRRSCWRPWARCWLRSRSGSRRFPSCASSLSRPQSPSDCRNRSCSHSRTAIRRGI